jgi:hypothetical protein
MDPARAAAGSDRDAPGSNHPHRDGFRTPPGELLRLDFEKASYAIGIQAAISMGIPLAVGIATGYPRIGAWGAVGSFFTAMAIFQPEHRPHVRIVAGAGALVAVGAFLGSYFGIHSLIIFPLVAVWTFGVGFAVVLSPQAALIGVSSATSMVFAAGLKVSHGQAVEVGVVTLMCGLLTALVTFIARPLTRSGTSASVRRSPPPITGLTWASQAWAKVRHAMATRNFAFWHALRLAIAAFIGTVLFRVIDAVDGFWIPESTLFIMRPDRDMTRQRALLRVIGSLVGAALTTSLLVVLRPDTTVLAVLVVLVSAVAFSVQRVNFGLYITFVTTIFVLLVAFRGLPPREAIFLRVVDNLIGSTIAVLAMFLWPNKLVQTAAQPDPSA